MNRGEFLLLGMREFLHDLGVFEQAGMIALSDSWIRKILEGAVLMIERIPMSP